MKNLLLTLTAAFSIACASKTSTPATDPAPTTGPVAYAPMSSIDTTKPATRDAFRRANEAAALVDTILASPDSLVLRVGETIQDWNAIKIEARNAAGQPIANFVPLTLIEDQTIVEEGPAGLVGRRPGCTTLTISPMSTDPNIHVRDVRAVVVLRVVP